MFQLTKCTAKRLYHLKKMKGKKYPLLNELDKIRIEEFNRTWHEVADVSGVSMSTISKWFSDGPGMFHAVEAVVNTLGYELKLVKKEKSKT